MNIDMGTTSFPSKLSVRGQKYVHTNPFLPSDKNTNACLNIHGKAGFLVVF